MPISYRQIIYADTMATLNSTAGSPGDLAFVIDVQLTYIYVTSWMPLNRTTIKKSTVTIDCKVAASTPIYTLENVSGLNFYPMMIIPRVVNITGVTTAPGVSIGTNATNYNDIASSTVLSTLLSALSAGSGRPASADYSPALPAGTVIYAKVTSGAIATTYQVKYDIIGYYEQ